MSLVSTKVTRVVPCANAPRPRSAAKAPSATPTPTSAPPAAVAVTTNAAPVPEGPTPAQLAAKKAEAWHAYLRVLQEVITQSSRRRYDAAGRVLFATWQIYALAHGASTVLVIVVVFEVLWAVAQLIPVRRAAS